MTEDTTSKKLYYTMGEVAGMLGENTSLVRYWADEFPKYIRPNRNHKGNRLFSAEDVANFKIIYYLVKECGMTLDGARKRMQNREGLDQRVEVINKLKEIKATLKEVESQL
ncbi:MAG: MerR family transcriptional regulator [Bacteroidales bacterium]|jgi:DNA-binding transcriptional MerR regulator|nr:MerR family transcriptional regulator [Bacteroidales bacterium]